MATERPEIDSLHVHFTRVLDNKLIILLYVSIYSGSSSEAQFVIDFKVSLLCTIRDYGAYSMYNVFVCTYLAFLCLLFVTTHIYIYIYTGVFCYK